MTPTAATRPKRPRTPWFLSQLLAALVALSLLVPASHAAASHIIHDASGGHIYWGGKYINIKPSQRGDVIGRRSQVDQMEVVMKDDIVTVKITGPYFHYYAFDVNRTRGIPPGDLYIASQGWKVKGIPPYSDDVFESSEGWDYVVSFTNKGVYTLNFSDIIWTRPQPGIKKFRAKQAWRGGYGQRLDDAIVELTDTYLSFTFSIRNMRLGPEIGLHWTMMCGNDIIEGSAPLPAIPVAPPSADPGTAQAIGADPLAEEVLPAVGSPTTAHFGAALPPSSAPWTVEAGGTNPPWAVAPPIILAAPLFFRGDDDDTGPPGEPPTGQSDTPTPVGEPPTLLLGLLGMFLLSAAPQFRLRPRA